ncbi:uncharacterized protein [Halyomorpha halys]|uniref:uncharacterized protein n=1 Tax=Halyomorpha halys TaxID=286706 RepID=UPI0006D509FB|nr:uncharacterized protein LOC106690695 [Halyomorpha halys]
MKELYFLFLLSCCSLAIVSSLHSRNFERTKAEDTDGSYSSNDLDVFPSCDMTSQFCDINCCSDQDCTELEKRSFKCSKKEKKDNSKFSYLDCENLGSLDSLGNPLLCLHDQNSPYLGDFYENDENFSSYSFSEILSARNKEISSFRIIDLLDNSSKNKFQHGSNIFFLDSGGEYHNIHVFSNVLSKGNGYCSKVPIRFLIDETSICFFHMNEEQCLLNEELHLQHHVNILKKLELLGDINEVNITYNVVCLRDETGFVSFHKDVFHGVTEKKTPSFNTSECESYATTEVSEDKTTCKNVVVGLSYIIVANRTVLRSVKVTILTVNIPLSIEGYNLVNKEVINPSHATKKDIIYTLQKTSVKFEDTDFVDLKKHGYVLGTTVYPKG